LQIYKLLHYAGGKAEEKLQLLQVGIRALLVYVTVGSDNGMEFKTLEETVLDMAQSARAPLIEVTKGARSMKRLLELVPGLEGVEAFQNCTGLTLLLGSVTMELSWSWVTTWRSASPCS